MKIFYAPQYGEIRATLYDGALWYALSGVARAMGYESPQAVKDVLQEVDQAACVATIRQPAADDYASVEVISYDGIVCLVKRKNNSSAYAFIDWLDAVSADSWSAPPDCQSALAETKHRKRQIASLCKERDVLWSIVLKQQPSSRYLSYSVRCRDERTLELTAKEYGISVEDFRAFLKANGLYNWREVFSRGELLRIYCAMSAKGIHPLSDREDVREYIEAKRRSRVSAAEKEVPHG